MFWEVLYHIFVPSSGLDENNIKKGAFCPVASLAPLYPISISVSRHVLGVRWVLEHLPLFPLMPKVPFS